MKRPNFAQIVALLATVVVVALIVLSILRVPDRAIAASTQLTGFIAVTGGDAASEEDIVAENISIAEVLILSSEGDRRHLVTNYEGQITLEGGSDKVTLSRLSVPHDWLLSVESGGEDGQLRISAQPAQGSAPDGRAKLSLVLPRGTGVDLAPSAGDESKFFTDQTTSLEVSTRVLDLSIKLARKDADIFGLLPVKALSLQRMRRHADEETGQERAEFSGSVRQGSLWIDGDKESPRSLNPIDRIKLGRMREAIMNVRGGGGFMEIVLRGRASEITNSQGDRAIDLRPSRLTVLAQNELLKILLAFVAFLTGLEITWRRRG